MAEPKLGNEVVIQAIHDPNVTFEEYLHHGAITRASEKELHGVEHAVAEPPNSLGNLAPNEKSASSNATAVNASNDKLPRQGVVAEEISEVPESNIQSQHVVIREADYVQASRAVRTATWSSVFFLITTDILGPFSTPWAFKQMGYGPSIALFTVFGAMACYGGFLLWKMYLALDSDKYPLKSYADIAFRVYGSAARQLVNILQSFQLLFNVGIIVVSNGQSLSQMVAKGPNHDQNGACFIILCFAWAAAGMVLGQIRTLQKLGHFANVAIWMNVFILISTMVVVTRTPPNYVAADKAYSIGTGPVVTSLGPPEGVGFQGQLVGLMQAVYSYGGAMLFVEFMAEMRRPMDFWKGMICAQAFIYVLYLLFGIFVYAYQGQYVINPVIQGISDYTWQTVGNAINLASSTIAAMLYGNIGIKVLYNNVLIDYFRFPILASRGGKMAWIAIVPIYWAMAFLLAAAIPQVSNLSAFIASLCIMQFSYTFPPVLYLGFAVKKSALQSGEGFDVDTGRTVRLDSGFARWVRGYRERWLLNTFNLLFGLGAAATAGLGIYSSIVGMIDSYKTNATTSFGCASPVL